MPRSTRLSAVLAAAAVAASLMAAPAPAAGQVSQAHKALKAGWTKYLSKQFNPAAYGDELSGAAGDAASALAKLGDEAAELRRFFDDAALRVAGEAAGGSAQGRELLEAVVRRIDVEGGARVPGAVDDVATSLMIMAKQIDVAKGLNGGAVPSGFKVPDGAAEILEAIQKRTAKQRAAAGGKMYRHPNGDYMSIAENVEARKLVQKLKGSADELSSAELQQIIDATKTPAAKRTVYQKTLMNRYRSYRLRAAAGKPKPKPKPKAAGEGRLLPSNEPPAAPRPKKGTKADDLDIREHATRAARRTQAQIVDSIRRAEFNAEVKAATLFDELGYVGTYARQAKVTDGDMFAVLLDRLDVVAKPGSRHSMKAGADDVLDELRAKFADLEELRKLNGGKLPEGVKDMAESQKALMRKLEDFFNGPPVPITKADGNYYSRFEMELYRRLLESARSGDWAWFQRRSSDFGPSLFKMLQFYDTPLERSLRRAFKAGGAKLPSEGGFFARRADLSVDVKWSWAGDVRRVLDAPPAHRNLADKSTWIQYVSRPGRGGFHVRSEAAEVERIVAGLSKGNLELNLETVSRLRLAVGKGSYNARSTPYAGVFDMMPGDIVLRDALFGNNEMLYKVMDPKWDAKVFKYQNGLPEATQVGARQYPAKYVAPDPAEVAARETARKADLDKAASETAERVGRSADELAALVKKADRDGKLAASMFSDHPTYWQNEVVSSIEQTASRNLRARRLADGDIFELVLSDVQRSLARGSDRPMRAAADDMLSALRRKAKNLDDLKAVHKGELPASVKDMTPAERETLEALEKWSRSGRRVKDADGWYYSNALLAKYDKAVARLEKLAGTAAGDTASQARRYLDMDTVRALLKYGDTELEKGMRRHIEAAKDRLLPGDLAEVKKLTPALTRRPVSDASKWLLKGDWPVGKLEALAAKLKGGATELTASEVARLRKATLRYTGSRMNSGSGTWTVHRVQDVYFRELLEKNRGALEEVMHPKWDQQVYRIQNGFTNSAMRKARPYLPE